MPAIETTISCAKAKACPVGRPFIVTFTLIGNDRADYCEFWPSREAALADAKRLKTFAPNATVNSDLGALI